MLINVAMCRTARHPSALGRLETDAVQSMLPLVKHTHLLRGEIPLGVEEVVLVLGEDGDIVFLHNGGVRALLDHLQVDGVGLIWPGKGERSVPTETSAPSGARNRQPQAPPGCSEVSAAITPSLPAL